jgi:hypothetical protein
MKLLLCLMLVCLSLAPLSALAQQNKATPKSVAATDPWLDVPCMLELKDATFADYLDILQRDLNLTLIADGTPLQKSVSLALDSTLREALDKVADAFDYRWRVGKNRVILLTKRFHNEQEMPQFILPELKQSAFGVMRVLGMPSISFGTHWEHSLDVFARLLSPQQMEWLQTSQPLMGKQLTPKQRAILGDAVLSNLLSDPFALWFDFHQVLSDLDKAKLVGERVGDQVRWRLVLPRPVKHFNTILNPIAFGR